MTRGQAIKHLEEIFGTQCSEKTSAKFESGLVLMGALENGVSVKKIAKWARLPRNLVSRKIKIGTENGIFKNRKISAGWFDIRFGAVAFIADSLVLDGFVKRVKEE